jgi:SAM-dependent methyltransferase
MAKIKDQRPKTKDRKPNRQSAVGNRQSPNWDERYARGEHATIEPNKLLVEWVRKLKGRYALDIACGAGRHSIFLAKHGWNVTAVDSSEVGIIITQARSVENNVGVKTVVADLEKGEFTIHPNYYDLICDFYYLQRDLFPKIKDGIRSGGAFIAAIHIVGAKRENGEDMNPAFLLEKNELREFFKDWEIAHYYETPFDDDDKGEHHHRTAEIVAIKPSA